MDTIKNIMGRASVRQYTERKIADEDVRIILEAAMAGPCCVNARDWSFIVVRDPDTLNKMADGNGPPAEPLRRAAMAVLICGDKGRAFEPAPDYWVIDGAIAGQNMILASHELGIGSVWLGTWPQMERVEAQAALFGLPETQVPHSIIAFGYPAEKPAVKPAWEDDRVHYERW